MGKTEQEIHRATTPTYIKETKSICVLGMHRSGTSLLSNFLNICGVYLGPPDELMPPVEADNPDGYWENLKFVDLNDALLGALGGHWINLPKIPKGWTDDNPKLESCFAQAKELTARFENTLWAWKDPRTLLTMEFWKKVQPSARLVFVLRNPIEVALSLARRPDGDGYVAFKDGITLWELEHRKLLEDVSLSDCVCVHFDHLRRDPSKEVRRVCDELGISVDPELVASLDGMVRSRSANVFPAKLIADLGIDPGIAEQYRALSLQCGVTEEEIDAPPSYEVLAQLSTQILAASTRDLKIATGHFHVQLAAKNRLKHEISALNNKNSELETACDALRADLDKEREEVQAMQRSLSWRVTQPLRTIRGAVKS